MWLLMSLMGLSVVVDVSDETECGCCASAAAGGSG